MKAKRLSLLGVLATAALTAPLLAGEVGEFSTQESFSLNYPDVTQSYFAAADAFPLSVAGEVDGYALAGRMLSAANQKLYLQKNFGAGLWLEVATVNESMDPSFVKISPSGAKVALGVGYYRPLFVFSPSLLSVTNPINLSEADGVLSITADYYDAVWYDERYLLINAGAISAHGEYGSVVYAVDTEAEDPESTFIDVVSSISGASGGVAVSPSGDVVTGIGYGIETGELKIWSKESIDSVLSGERESLDYEETGVVVIEQALSAASLGFDTSGNLHVGGGDVFRGSGSYGYALLISHQAIEEAQAGGGPADPNDLTDVLKFAPDPCENDDTVGVQFVEGLEMLVVTSNLASLPPNCESTDWSVGGADAPIQLYFSSDAPDSDGDGIPDGADNAYLTYNPDQIDADGDGFGDAADIDVDDDNLIGRAELSALLATYQLSANDQGFDERFDFDRSGGVDWSDYQELMTRWGQAGPFY